MATFSDGDDDGLHLSNMAGHSPYSSSSGDMRFHLQTLLDGKEKQLQQAGTLGQQLLTQRMELEERIRQLQEMDFEGGESDEVRDRYRELVDTIKAWDVENEQLSSAFGLKVNGAHATPAVELTRTELERSVERSKASATGTTAAQSSRRAKNAAHRADDVEFAFEIGSGLLTEVRRLQSLLAERDKAIQDMKEEKDDIEKTVESLRAALRQQEQSADKFKEENWNLEVTLQELRVQLTESQGSAQRLEGEQKRLTKLLTTTREAVDQHKNEAERHHNALLELKAKHEADVAQARRHAASLQRDKSDLQQTLDALKADVAKANRKLPRFGSPLTPNGTNTPTLTTPAPDEDDVFGTAGASTNNRKRTDSSGLFPLDDYDYANSSPEQSPSRPFLAPNHPSNEIEALQQRLAHAQRQINTLKGSLQREKELRIEYKRKLEAANDGVDEEEEEAELQTDGDEVRPKARLTPYRTGKGVRGRGRGRGRGGLTLMQRLAAHSPGSEFDDDDDEEPAATAGSSVQSRLASVPIDLKSGGLDATEEDLLHDSEVQDSPSLRPPSNRTSVDGMDPAFANVLRRSTSGKATGHNASPLRHSVFSRGKPLSRKSRGGAAFQEARPPSFAAEPEALASELGQFAFEPLEDTFELPEPSKETTEIGCQTDLEEPLVPSVVVQSPTEPELPPSRAVAEMGIQVEPTPEPVLVRIETSAQTDEKPAVIHSDMAVQHFDPTPARVFASTGSITDPIVIPAVPQPAVLIDADIQTTEEAIPSKQYADAQTFALVPEAEKVEAESQTPVVRLSDISVQATHTEEASPVYGASYTESSVGDTSEDATVIIRAPVIIGGIPTFEEDDGTQTETGSFIETDTDDYVDARQSISLTTPTESLDDYHSIMTVTDNDFSDDSDEESIKASRLSSRQGRTSSLSAIQDPAPSTSVLLRTYEHKGVSAEADQPAPVEVPAPTPIIPLSPPRDLKETSMQTDEWTLPAIQSTASSPAPATSPVLFRVGPSSQQFQFISPPPSAGPTTTSLPIVPTPSPSATLRDSGTSLIPRPRTSHSDRRQSIESTLSSARDDAVARSRTPSNVASLVDKSRPPMMVLPPPPRLPPPPNSMPPPTFIPEKRQPTPSTTSRDGPPPRPLSPPPPELIQRATTPTFGQALSVPSSRPFGLRSHTSSMASSQGGLRQPSSTGSFRLSAAARAAQQSPSAASFNGRRELSTTSLTSGRQSVDSHRSSISSDHLPYDQPSQPRAPATPERTVLTNRSAINGSTDPAIIHAITQTMIGEFLYKYTRRTIGKGYGERRHKRFFWVHPYTRTLYWSSADPGSSNVSESSAKSAYVEAVRSVLDPNPLPPGIYQYSVVVSTPQREMKFTAPTKERHDIWLNALQYLLTRPNPTAATSPASGPNALASPLSLDADLPDADSGQRPTAYASPQSQRSVRTTRTGISVDSWTSTPRGQRSQSQLSMRSSMGKRSGTPAAEYLRWGGPETPNSPEKSFEHIPRQDEELDFELNEETLSDGGFEGLENVRACCDGRHTVGRSGKPHHHHHHHHPPAPSQPQPPSRARDVHLDPHPAELTRPVSPAWSFRSRAGSTNSNDGGGFFSRFGTRRSTKTVTAEHR